MSNVEKFEELLRSDEGLQAKLRAATEAYAGDTSDEQAFFDAVLAPIAAEAALPFTYDEVVAAKDDEELDDAELDAVASGTGYCIFIGGSDDVESGCNEIEGHACAYIGVGVPHIKL